MNRPFIYLLFIVGCFALVKSQSSSRLKASACAGKSISIDCGTGKTVVVYEALLGNRLNDNGQCEYTSGDCTENIDLACLPENPKCSSYLSSNRNLTSKCQNKKADYIEVRYYCVPMSSPNFYEVCNTNDINQQSGIVRSPKYPTYQVTSGNCVTKITVPVGKTLNIWITDMNIPKRDSSENCNDYLRITDTTGSYDICGQERPVFVEDLCSSVIYISYNAATPPGIFSFFKGFKFYYEVRDLGSTSACGTATPTLPALTTTTMVQTSLNPQDTIMFASDYKQLQVCKGKTEVITAPELSIVYIEDIKYKVQLLQLFCSAPSPTHCESPYPLTCNLQKSCSFNLLTDYTVDDCGRKKADYLYAIYRFIPIDSRIKYSMCDTSVVNADLNPNGVIISKGYPSYSQNVFCSLRLQTSMPGKSFKVYITDINIEDSLNCASSYVQLKNEKYCGSVSAQKSYDYTECSNSLILTYKTSANNSLGYRGFRAYYEMIDLPDSCRPTTTSTRPPLITTTAPLNDDVTSQVTTSGGNANGRPCVFPFIYQSNSYDSCIKDGSNYWCSVTDNFDRDGIKGNCNSGFTKNVKFSVCERKLRTFSCPKGYLINLISVQGVSTSDNSCDESKTQCTQSLYSEVQAVAGGKNSYRIINSYLLTSCSNVRANILIIDYNCIPETVPYVQSYDSCSNSQINTENGIIYSPNYPNLQTNLNCSIQINTNGLQKLLNVYAVSLDLQITLGNQECQDSFIQINNGEKFCGSRRTTVITQKCGTSFSFNYFVGTRGYKGFKVFYQITNVNDPIQCYEPTTYFLSTSTVSLQTQPPYVQQGLASGTQVVVNCRFSETITCPDNYIISVKRYFYGRSNSSKCFYTQGDQISYSFQNVNCNGKKTCALPSYFQFMPEYGIFSTYLQVEYECIPTNLPRKPMCGQVFSDRNGIISSPNYPIYDQSLNCKATITVPVGFVIKAYIINLSIDKDCSKDNITFTEKDSISVPFCGLITGGLAYETCEKQLDINLVTRATIDNSFTGVLIYYEVSPRPFDFICSRPTTTTTTTRPTTTVTTKSTTTVPSYIGLASPLTTIIGCKSETVVCPNDYVLVIKSAFYGVKNSNNECSYDPNDCFGPFTTYITPCSGRQSCYISFFTATTEIPECQKRKADYFFFEYQCIPVKNAGKPPTATNSEFCIPPTTSHTINPGSGLILQSEKYPTYPTTASNCTKNVTTSSEYALAVYLTSASFPGRIDCNNSKDFLEITDGYESFKFCGTHQTKFLLQSRYNWLQIKFTSNTPLIPLFLYRGFQLYIETVKVPELSTRPTRPPTTTVPIQIGFASQEYYNDLCVYDTKDIQCPSNYVIVVLSQTLVNSRQGCNYGPGDCREPTDLVSDTCAGKNSCKIYFPYIQTSLCGRGYASGLEFTYQCVPSSPTQTIKSFSCEDKEISKSKNGIIQSPQYPNYALNIDNCMITVNPPENTEIRFYLIDLALTDQCYADLVTIDDLLLCENEDGVSRYLYSSSSPVVIRYKSQASINVSMDILRGFRLYFEAFPIRESTTVQTTIGNNSFTRKLYLTKIPKTNKSSNLIYASFGIGIPAIALIIVLMYYINKNGNSSGSNLEIKYSNTEGRLSEDIKSFSNPILD